MARWIIITGLVVTAIGLALHYAPWLVNWFGRLPGDIRVETGRTRLFVPLTSMVVLSVIVTVLLHIFRR